jgi:hypothetical protein
MMPVMFTCADCGETIKYHNKSDCGGTGYAIVREGGIEKKVCYACCALRDLAGMNGTGRVVLYLTGLPGAQVVTNWPGTLKFPVVSSRKGRHNIAGSREDVYFVDGNGKRWHGVQLGDFSQICRCRRLKAA